MSLYSRFMQLQTHLNYDDRREDIAYHKTLIEWLLRTSFQKDVGTGGSQQKLTICRSMHKSKKNEENGRMICCSCECPTEL